MMYRHLLLSFKGNKSIDHGPLRAWFESVQDTELKTCNVFSKKDWELL